MAKKIRIIAKRTGLGNQIQFIPFLLEMQKNHEVVTDSNVYNQFGIDIPVDSESKVDENYIVYGYGWNLVLKTFFEYFGKGKKIGFKYRIKGRYFGLGLNESIKLDESKNEVENNKDLTGIQIDKFYLPGHNPIPKRIAVGVSEKPGKNYEYWDDVGKLLESEGYDVKLYGDYGTTSFPKEKTPTLRSLYEELCKAEYYIGTDNGITHLADFLGIPGLVIFGNTSIPKNRPYNDKIKVVSKYLDCAPCYKIIKECNNPKLYDCLDIPPKKIFDELKSVMN